MAVLANLGLIALTVLFAVLALVVVPKVVYWNFPGPKPHLLFGSFYLGNVKPGRSPHHFLKLREEYGRVYQVWALSRRVFVDCNPEDLRYVTLGNPQPKSRVFHHSLQPLVGDGLLTVNDNIHKAHRRMLGLGLSKEFYNGLEGHIAAEIEVLFSKLDEAADKQEVIDVDASLTRFALDVILRSAFSESIGAQTNPDLELPTAMSIGLKEVFRRTLLYPVSLVLPLRESLKSAKAVADKFVLDLADKRRNETLEAQAQRFPDLLDAVLGMEGADSELIRGELITFVVAGHDTTAHSLAFMIYELCKYPQVQQRIFEEVSAVLGSRDIPGQKDISRLPYTAAAWKEALRLHPVAATGTIREAKETITLPSGWVAPKGTEILFPIYLMHRDPENWPEPDEFKPERFMEPNKPKPFTYVPFSLGSRNCIGQAVANQEGVTTIAAICKRYRLSLPVDPSEISEFHALVMRPKCRYQGKSIGLPLRVERRL